MTPAAEESARVPIGLLYESEHNTRTRFDPAKLAELADSIRAQGIIEPLIVREQKSGKKLYEIVAGARRFRAAAIAGQALIPVVIRALTDEAALELQLVENDQREDMHALDRAAGYRRLLDQCGYDVKQIAARTGKSPETIYAHLKLLDLAPDPHQALAADRLTAGHAVLIARLQPAGQKKALAACFDWDKSLRSVRALDAWIEQHIRLPLDSVPWKLDDAALVPAAGACAACPKREESGKHPRCLDPHCYQDKKDAWIEQQKARVAQKTGAPPLLVSEAYGGKPAKGTLTRHDYVQVPAGQTGKDVQPALIVDGDRLGQVIQVRRKQDTPQAANHEAERRKDEEARAREEFLREALLDAVLEKIKAPLPRPDLEMILEALLEGDSDLGALRQRFGLPETRKSYDTADVLAFARMAKPQQLAHLLLLASLDPYRTGDPRLQALAQRYKVNPDKVKAKAAEAWKRRKAEVQTSAKEKGAAS